MQREADGAGFRKRLRELMARKNISARALSLRAGLSPDAVRNILRGRAENPRRRTLEGIARELGITVEDLVRGATAD